MVSKLRMIWKQTVVRAEMASVQAKLQQEMAMLTEMQAVIGVEGSVQHRKLTLVCNKDAIERNMPSAMGRQSSHVRQETTATVGRMTDLLQVSA